MEKKSGVKDNKKSVTPVRNHGRRKTAVARVWLLPKSDHSENESFAQVNDKPIAEYFPGKKAESFYLQPFQLAGVVGKYSASIKVEGGGIIGQLEAVVHGLARALVETNPSLREVFKKEKLLTRDSRMKERKKYGLRRARRRQQWSKR